MNDMHAFEIEETYRWYVAYGKSMDKTRGTDLWNNMDKESIWWLCIKKKYMKAVDYFI